MNKVILLETRSDMFCGLVAFTLYSQICEWKCGLYFFIFKSSVAFFKKLSFVLFSLGVFCSVLRISPMSPTPLPALQSSGSLPSLWRSRGKRVNALTLSLTSVLADPRCYIIKIKGNDRSLIFFVTSQHTLPFLFPWIQRHEKCCNWKQQAESQPHCFRSCSKVCLISFPFLLLILILMYFSFSTIEWSFSCIAYPIFGKPQISWVSWSICKKQNKSKYQRMDYEVTVWMPCWNSRSLTLQ